MRASPPRQVGELERDVSRTDERDSRWQLVEFEESGARDQLLLAGPPEPSRLCTRSDHEVARFEHVAIDRELVRPYDPPRAMIRRDPRLFECPLPVGGDRIGEGPLEPHQVGPGDLRVAGYSPVPHPAIPVRDLRGAHEDFLGVAAAQRARATVGEIIEHRYAPARLPAPVGGRGTAGPRADDDEVTRHRWDERS